MKQNSNKNGSSLIIVLIIFSISVMLTAFAINLSRKNIFSSAVLMDKLRADIEAESVVEKIKFYASTGVFFSYWIQNKFSSYLKFPVILYIDGRRQMIDNNTIITLQDTGGLINIWNFYPSVVENLLKKNDCKKSKIRVVLDSIKDWYDKDNFCRMSGAEASFYVSKGCLYAPRNSKAAQSIYEWRIIKGIMDDNKTFDFLKKYIVISPNWRPNIDTMDKYMLSAFFDIPLDVAVSILKFKKKRKYLYKGDIETLFGIKDICPEESFCAFPTFTLDIDVEYRFNKAMEKKRCLIDFKPDEKSPYRVLEWQD